MGTLRSTEEGRIFGHAADKGPTGSQIYGHADASAGRTGGSKAARLRRKGGSSEAAQFEQCAGREAAQIVSRRRREQAEDSPREERTVAWALETSARVRSFFWSR
jgi:hypothetical protein